MLTYQEYIELRAKLAVDQINLDEVKVLLWSNFNQDQRSWHTIDWKERRLLVLKDKCEICSSTDTLTIQHLSHPRKYAEILHETKRKYIGDTTFKAVNKSELTEYLLKNYEYEPVLWCPKCNNKHPKERVRKTPKYRCADCKHEFDNEVYKTVEELVDIYFENPDAYEIVDKCFTATDKGRNKYRIAQVNTWMLQEAELNKNREPIEKEALLAYLDENIKYLSFEDSITACRRCAYKLDVEKKDLCPHCKQKFKGIQYPTCLDCIPPDKKKAVLESIAFGKEWHKMHKGWDID